MIPIIELPKELEDYAHQCKRILTNGTKQAHCVYWDVQLEKIAVLSVTSEYRGELLYDGTFRYIPIAKFDYELKPHKPSCQITKLHTTIKM